MRGVRLLCSFFLLENFVEQSRLCKGVHYKQTTYLCRRAAPTAAAEPLTADQKKTRRIRSHLSGNHPQVAAGDDCLSRKAANLRSHTSGEASAASPDARKAVGGTVTHH